MARSRQPTGPTLRLLSYNVHGLRDDLGAMTALVRSLDPDVMVIQEGPRRMRWRTRCADLAHRFGLFYVCGGLPALGNLILASMRVRVHDTWCVQFPLTPGKHMRGAALARCSVGAASFVVAGSHLATAPSERPAQAAILAKVLSEVDVPAVLAADLNDTSASAAWRTLVDGRVDVAQVAGHSATPTFPVLAPRQRIDAIFADQRFDVASFRVVDTPEARRASDHFPLLADLDLRTPSINAEPSTG
jgi:endonuclease/exonuclease/phosphatase family metal-dependent hydrolase